MSGNIVHFELTAKDAKRARDFYTKLFGWGFKDANMPGVEYWLTEGSEPGGAISPMGDGKGPYVYFGTDDIDASVRKIRELGGTAEDKQPIPGEGWFSRVVDTEGNSWALFQPDRSIRMPEPQGAATADR